MDIDKILYYTVNAKYHLWYLPSLIGVYFLYPILWAITRYKNGRYFKYACIMFVMFGIFRSTFLEVVDSTFIQKFSYALADLSGYFLLGYGFEHYQDKFKKIKTWQLLLIFILNVIIAAICNWNYGMSVGTQTTLFYSRTSIFVFLEACCLFILFLRIPQIKIFENNKDLITKISKNTLLVYVLHVFVFQHLNSWFHINTLTLSPLIMVPLLAIGIFVICQLVALVLGRIPVLKKWIM